MTAEHRHVDFTTAFPLTLKNAFQFEGRSSRGAYWWFVLWSLLISLVASVIDASLFGSGMTDPTPLSNLLALLLFIPELSLSIRRLHDIGRSGWWSLLALTIIGLIPLIYWAAQPGERRTNDFGPDVEQGKR